VRTVEDNILLLLVIAVTLAFAWILWPFFGAVLWAAVLAIVFAPLHRRLLSLMPQRRNLAAPRDTPDHRDAGDCALDVDCRVPGGRGSKRAPKGSSPASGMSGGFFSSS
jgi:hypothetical protein